MKLGTTETLKFIGLQARLGFTRWQTIGVLETLWMVTAQSAPRGDIGRHSNERIAAGFGWPVEKADELIGALVAEGWIDECAEHRLLVHDWPDHMPDMIRKRLERMGLEPIAEPSRVGQFPYGGGQRQTTADNGGQRQPTAASREDGMGWDGMESNGTPERAKKTKTRKPEPAPEAIPAGLDSEPFRSAWADWHRHRRELRKPMTPTSRAQLLAQLAEWGQDRAIVAIRHTIAKGWQGLREPEASRLNGHHPGPERTVHDQIRAQLERMGDIDAA